jgi:hypothetical protein
MHADIFDRAVRSAATRYLESPEVRVAAVNVADSGVRSEYAGTIFQSAYNGASSFDHHHHRKHLTDRPDRYCPLGWSASFSNPMVERPWRRFRIMSP